MNKISVLFLGADGTQALSIAESLHTTCRLHGFFRHKLSYGYASRYFTYRKIVIPQSFEEYVRIIIDYVKDNKIDILFPMSDKTAELLSLNKSLLGQHVKFVIPDSNSFYAGYDKNQLMRVCNEIKVFHPRTIDLDVISRTLIPNDIFPALIKPNITTGGRGMALVHSMDEFDAKYPNIHSQYGSCHLQEFIQSGGKQIKVQLFVDNNGSLLCCSVLHKQRYYPENGGSSCCNVTVTNEDAVSMCHKILRSIQWEGFADFDLIEDPKDGKLKVMEINPRVPACVKSCIKSGADFAKLYVAYALGRDYETFFSQPGYQLRFIGFDIMWFIHCRNRWKSNPSWFRFAGRNLYYQDFSWKDPFPFISGSLASFSKLFSPQLRKQKSVLR